MKPLHLFAAVSIATCSAVNSHAGTADNGTLYQVHFMNNGVVIAYITGTRTGAPTCATITNRFAVDATTPAGKVLLAGLLASHATKTPVRIVGTGTCTAWGDTETINYMNTWDN